jgi:hypothetical protein
MKFVGGEMKIDKSFLLDDTWYMGFSKPAFCL